MLKCEQRKQDRQQKKSKASKRIDMKKLTWNENR